MKSCIYVLSYCSVISDRFVGKYTRTYAHRFGSLLSIVGVSISPSCVLAVPGLLKKWQSIRTVAKFLIDLSVRTHVQYAHRLGFLDGGGPQGCLLFSARSIVRPPQGGGVGVGVPPPCGLTVPGLLKKWQSIRTVVKFLIDLLVRSTYTRTCGLTGVFMVACKGVMLAKLPRVPQQ